MHFHEPLGIFDRIAHIVWWLAYGNSPAVGFLVDLCFALLEIDSSLELC